MTVNLHWHAFKYIEPPFFFVSVSLLEVHTYSGLFRASVILLDRSQVIWFPVAPLMKATGLLAEAGICTSYRFALAVYWV